MGKASELRAYRKYARPIDLAVLAANGGYYYRAIVPDTGYCLLRSLNFCDLGCPFFFSRKLVRRLWIV